MSDLKEMIDYLVEYFEQLKKWKDEDEQNNSNSHRSVSGQQSD